MIISKTKDRSVETFDEASGDIRITVRSRWLPRGYQRHQWESYDLVLTPEEIRKIAASLPEGK